MQPEAPPPQEREDTDKSLRVERDNTDAELGKKRDAIAEAGEAVLEKARDKASEVLETARAKADLRLDDEAATRRSRADVTHERARDDHALEQDQALSARRLTAERALEERAVDGVLERERAVTDEHLRVERARADHAVTSRDDFLAIVSHDVRTLLTGIGLHAAVLIAQAGQEDGGKSAVATAEKISRLTRRMGRLVGDLVDVVSIDAGKLSVALLSDDASRLGAETLDAFTPAAAAKGVALDAGATAGPLPARFDRGRVLQVLANLAGNAIKFTPEGGRVTIDLEVAGGELLFSVADTGAGISAEDLPLIFERFWQAGPGDRRGLGLGLYIARCIVEAHGGKIWAESKLGEGTTVRFTLPLSEVEGEHAHPAGRPLAGA